jgi:hypothetical protein
VTLDKHKNRRSAQRGATIAKRPGQEPITFKYIRVPADESKPYEELTGEMFALCLSRGNHKFVGDIEASLLVSAGEGYTAEDSMPTLLKAAFAGGSIDASTAKKTALAQMGSTVSGEHRQTPCRLSGKVAHVNSLGRPIA